MMLGMLFHMYFITFAVLMLENVSLQGKLRAQYSATFSFSNLSSSHVSIFYISCFIFSTGWSFM